MAVKGVQFVSDSDGHPTGVLIDLRRHRTAWEDLYDVIVAESRRHDRRISVAELKRRLMRPGKRRA